MPFDDDTEFAFDDTQDNKLDSPARDDLSLQTPWEFDATSTRADTPAYAPHSVLGALQKRESEADDDADPLQIYRYAPYATPATIVDFLDGQSSDDHSGSHSSLDEWTHATDPVAFTDAPAFSYAYANQQSTDPDPIDPPSRNDTDQTLSGNTIMDKPVEQMSDKALQLSISAGSDRVKQVAPREIARREQDKESNDEGEKFSTDTPRIDDNPLQTTINEYNPNTGLTTPLIVRRASDSNSYSNNYSSISANETERRARSTLEANQLYDQVMGTTASDIMPTLTLSEPEGSQLAYDGIGHYYTAYYTALKSGFPLDQSHEIAIGAQLPDQIGELDAIANSVQDGANLLTGAFPGANERRKLFSGGLHVLTGGDANAQLSNILLNISQQDPNDFMSVGFFTHALGDDFAHRTLADPSITYSPLVGHLRDMTSPDQITLRPDLYKSYVETLSDAYTSLRKLPKDQADEIRNNTSSELQEIVRKSMIYDASGTLNSPASEKELLKNMREAVRSEISKNIPEGDNPIYHMESPEATSPGPLDGPEIALKNLHDFLATNPSFDKNTPLSAMEGRASEAIAKARKVSTLNLDLHNQNAFISLTTPGGKPHRDR